MMTQIEDLIAAIGNRKAEQADVPFLVAIDGHSAAGKSTLSRALTKAWPDAALVATDDFYRVMDAEERFALDASGGYESYYDQRRLRIEALEPLKAFRPARFQIYDWGQNKLGAWREIQAPQWLLSRAAILPARNLTTLSTSWRSWTPIYA